MVQQRGQNSSHHLLPRMNILNVQHSFVIAESIKYEIIRLFHFTLGQGRLLVQVRLDLTNPKSKPTLT